MSFLILPKDSHCKFVKTMSDPLNHTDSLSLVEPGFVTSKHACVIREENDILLKKLLTECILNLDLTN